jgi:hypothetical protein
MTCIKVFVEGVVRVGPSGVGRRWQDVVETTDDDDVRGVPTASRPSSITDRVKMLDAHQLPPYDMYV